MSGPNDPMTTVLQMPSPSFEGDDPVGPVGDDRGLRSVFPVVLIIVATVACTLLDGLYANTAWSIAGLVLTVPLGAVCVHMVPSWSRNTWVVIGAIAALAVLAGISQLWSVAPSRSWIEANRIVLYLAFIVILLALLRTAAQRRGAVAAVALAIGAMLTSTFVVGLLGDPGSLFLIKRLHSPIEYINGVAGLAAIGVWPAVSLMENARKPVLAGLGAACGALALSTIVLTQSRSVAPALLISGFVVLALLPGRRYRFLGFLAISAAALAAAPFTLAVFSESDASQAASNDIAGQALLAALVTSIVCGVIWSLIAGWAGRNEETARRGAKRVATVLVAIGAVAAVVSAPKMYDVGSTAYTEFRTLSTDEPTDLRFTSGGGNRAELWRVAVAEWKDAPIIGIGAGGYGVRWYRERHITEAIRQPHSLPLQVLAELGLLGAALLAIAIGGMVVASVTTVRRASYEERAMLAGSIGAVCTWFTHTSLDWLHNLPAVTGMALVPLAVILAQSSALAPPLSRKRLVPIRWVAVGSLAIATASFGVQLAVEAYANRASEELDTDASAARRSALRATQLDGGSVRAWTLLAASEARLGSYEKADRALRRAIAAEPEAYSGYTLRGDLAMRAGLTDLARQQYTEALRLNPLDPGLPALIASTRLSLHRPLMSNASPQRTPRRSW